jgi:hypothetical protein
MGLLLGLGFWESLQLVAVIVPALAWLTVRRPRIWRDAWVAVPTAALGSLPWILSNLQHDGWSFVVLGGGSTYVGRLRGFASSTLPMILGLRIPLSVDWTLGTLVSVVMYGAILLAFAAAAWHWRRSPLSLLPAIAAGYPFIYALSEQTSITAEPRYVVVLLPVLVMMIGKAARSLPAAAIVLAAALGLSAVGLARWIDDERAVMALAPHNIADVALGPTIAALQRAGIDRAYADYWIAYRTTFDTRERIVVSEFDPEMLARVRPGRVLPPVPRNYHMHHHPAYDTAVRSARRFAYVLLVNEPGEAHDARLLVTNGFTEERVGTMRIFISPLQHAGA